MQLVKNIHIHIIYTSTTAQGTGLPGLSAFSFLFVGVFNIEPPEAWKFLEQRVAACSKIIIPKHTTCNFARTIKCQNVWIEWLPYFNSLFK